MVTGNDVPTTGAKGSGAASVGVFDTDKIYDQKILHFILRTLLRTVNGTAYGACLVPQVGPSQGTKVELRYRMFGLPPRVRRDIEAHLAKVDVSEITARTIATKKIEDYRVTYASISSQYDINLGAVALVHQDRVSYRLIRLWLDVFEAIVSFRKEARALRHHRLLFGLDTRDRQALDRSIGNIIHRAIHPHRTIIFVPERPDVFRASYISEGRDGAPAEFELHVPYGSNLLTSVYSNRSPQSVGQIGAVDKLGLATTPFENFCALYGYSSCLMTPVFSGDRCYCVIACLFRRPNAVSLVEQKIVNSLSELLADYYRLWYRNNEVELSYAEADDVLKQVRQLLLVVDVLHDAAHDLTTARGHLGMLDPRTDAERETLAVAKNILTRLMTATNHFKSFYRRHYHKSPDSGRLDDFRPERISPSLVVNTIEKKYRHDLSRNKIDLVNACPRDMTFWGVEQCVTRSIDNAVKNSIAQLQMKSHVHREIRISCRPEVAPSDGSHSFTSRMFAIEVLDNGPGIAPELLTTVRKRYVSHRGGMGLGVPIMEGACETHGGSLTLASTWGKGFTATLRFREMRGGE